MVNKKNYVFQESVRTLELQEETVPAPVTHTPGPVTDEDVFVYSKCGCGWKGWVQINLPDDDDDL